MTAKLPDPMLPTPFVVQKVKRETSDTYTLDLTRADGAANFAFAPGQFNMLYAFGAGEVPISISGDPARPGTLARCLYSVGYEAPDEPRRPWPTLAGLGRKRQSTAGNCCP